MNFVPGMRVIICDEEWLVRKSDTNSYGSNTLFCMGLWPLAKDKSAYFLNDLESVKVVNPHRTKLVIDNSYKIKPFQASL